MSRIRLCVPTSLVEIHRDAIACHGAQAHQVSHVLALAVERYHLTFESLRMEYSLIGIETLGEVNNLFDSLRERKMKVVACQAIRIGKLELDRFYIFALAFSFFDHVP